MTEQILGKLYEYKDEVHPEQVFEKIYRGKVQHMKCNEVEAIIQSILK